MSLATGQTLGERMEELGVTRRSFLRFCGVMASTLALPAGYRTQIAEALTSARRPVLVWLEFQDCAGNSESILRSSHPDVADIVLDTLSWEYHELIMAGAGEQAEAQLQRVVREEKGRYIAVVEGSIPTADGGVYCTIGGRTALDIAREVCPNAAATHRRRGLRLGRRVRHPRPTGAVGVQEAVPEAKVVNLGGCPHNPANTAAVLVHYLTFGEMPELDGHGRPLFAYGDLIHDQCERRAYFDAGCSRNGGETRGTARATASTRWAARGRRPPTTARTSAGTRARAGPCRPVTAASAARHRASGRTRALLRARAERPGLRAETTAETIGLTVVGAVAAASAAHGVAKVVQSRRAATELAAEEHAEDQD